MHSTYRIIGKNAVSGSLVARGLQTKRPIMSFLRGVYLTCYRGVGRAFGLSLMPSAPGRRRAPTLTRFACPPAITRATSHSGDSRADQSSRIALQADCKASIRTSISAPS